MCEGKVRKNVSPLSRTWLVGVPCPKYLESFGCCALEELRFMLAAGCVLRGASCCHRKLRALGLCFLEKNVSPLPNGLLLGVAFER